MFPVAHISLYGYGFRPYEYASVPGRGGSHDNTTLSRQAVDKELQQHGMFAMRSHIIPAFYTVTLWAATAFTARTNFVVVSNQRMNLCQGKPGIFLMQWSNHWKISRSERKTAVNVHSMACTMPDPEYDLAQCFTLERISQSQNSN